MILGIGVDLADVEALRRMSGPAFRRFAERVLGGRELDYCFSQPDPYQCVAARFAAKEAFAKALGIEDPSRVGFRDVEVVGVPPRLEARGAALEELKRMGAARVHVSLTHIRSCAAAVVVIES